MNADVSEGYFSHYFGVLFSDDVFFVLFCFVNNNNVVRSDNDCCTLLLLTKEKCADGAFFCGFDDFHDDM